jgi:hypothetical protein
LSLPQSVVSFLLTGKVAIPSLESPAGIEVTRFWKETYHRVASISIGPVTFEDEVKKILETPKEVRAVAMTPLGYPNQSPSQKFRKSLNEIVIYSYEKYE